jgi:hypothetical protein
MALWRTSERAISSLDAPQLDAAELLDHLPPVLPVQDLQEVLWIAGLLGDHPVMIAGTTDLEPLHLLEAVVEPGGGPFPEEGLHFFLEFGRHVRRAPGSQGVEDPLLGTAAAVLEDDLGHGGVGRSCRQEASEERTDDVLFKLFA